MPASATELGWRAIFQELSIPSRLKSEGVAFVTANEIRCISGREPRLMTKFDTRDERPRTLINHRVTVLAVENGRYALVHGDGYYDVKRSASPQFHTSERLRPIQSLPWQGGLASESQALDSAFIASILRQFTGEDGLHLTVRGRLRSAPFEFDFQGFTDTHRLKVDGVQIEVDGGYEGSRMYLIEAKMGVRENFIVRQLYYPFRMWADGDRINKEVVPILMTYSNRVFSLRGCVRSLGYVLEWRHETQSIPQ